MRRVVSVTARHIAFLFSEGADMTLIGQVGIVHSRRWGIGRLVQLVTGSHWNHTIVALPFGRCVSAEPGGAIVRPIAYYTRDHDIAWSQFTLDRAARHRIVEVALRHKGVEYGYGDFIAAGIASITRRATPEWLRRIVSRPDRLICSQLCDLALQAGGEHLFRDNRPNGAVTPADFGREYRDRGWTDRD